MSPLPAPFSPLVSGGEGLERCPGEPTALRRRMAEVYGVTEDHVLPVRGVSHGVELVLRLAALEGASVEAPENYADLTRLYRSGEGPRLARVAGGGGALGALRAEAEALASALLVLDEGAVEFGDTPSAAALIGEVPNVIVLRSLSLAYGLAGARVGAALGQPATLARLAGVLEPHALPEPSVRLALQALDPSRMLETQARITAVRSERVRLAEAIPGAVVGAGPWIDAAVADTAGLRALAVPFETVGDQVRLPVFAKAELNDRTLAALGVATAGARANRTGQSVRDTKETRIVCAVDLDATGPITITTGVGFFDHMLEQVAAHGGFSLRLACEGDLHTDPHHTIEDSAIALGQALKQALGERKGIARYGFVLPMDEAEAKVSIDLSGRPYPVFEGTFTTPFIGEYRTDLTEHVFRSLAEHLGAAVHIAVTGQDDHHKTEAVYKAFGRALRQAIRVEGDAVPSTKGVL